MKSKVRHPIAIVIIWLIIGVGLLCSYWLWDWRVLTAVATWVLAAGIGVAIWQIREAKKSTNAQIAIGLFQELRSNDTLKTLRYIYGLEPENIKNLSQDDKNKITYVLERLSMLGALIANGIIDEKLAIEIYGGATALKCWYQLKDYISGVENRQGLQWGMHVEDFAARALEYWKDYKPKWVLYYRNEGDEPIDLVEKLRTDKDLRPRLIKDRSLRKPKSEGER